MLDTILHLLQRRNDYIVNRNLQQVKGKLQSGAHAIKSFLHNIKRILLEQFNKNIYTRILFTNAIVFIIALIVLMLFSNFMVKQATYDQVQQDLLRKSKRVNFVLTTKELTWKNSITDQTEIEQDLLRFLADSFDARITVFDRQGTIISTSAEQEVVPGSKVDTKFVEKLTSGETSVTRTADSETGQLTFTASIPMGNNEDTNNTVENGILLETQPANLDITINKMNLILLLGGIVVLIIIIVVSVYLAMCISRPISRLATSITEINMGSYANSNDEQPLDEINVLARQVNKLKLRLENMQAESYKIEEERTRLFAEISHELRTPLTAVQGFTEAIRDGMVEDEALQKKYLDMIYTQTLHINRLVDDILSLSRLESGAVTVKKLPLDLVALAGGVVMSMEGLAKKNNNSILFEQKIENAVVVGDVDRMEQILRNLLKNSINATENGIIKVGVEPGQYEVIVTIEDNGIGITPDDLPHIWDRFYRVKNIRNINMTETGTGLGLVIVKKLVQLQDGKIDAESKIGNGTTFRISFPLFIPKN